MKRSLTLFLFALTLSLTGQEIPVPDLPADHVLDQTGRVTSAERQAVQAEMELVAGKTGLGIYLVVLDSSAEEPPADVARRLAQSWKGNADRVVVLNAPGITPPLVVAVSGESLGKVPEEQVRRMSDTAVAAGQRATPGLTALLETARSMTAQVEELRKSGVLGSEPIGTVVAVTPVNEPKRYLVAWIAGGSLACCLLALLLMRRGRHSAFVFPQTAFRHRFSAPHSGGNDALVHFGK